MQWKKLGKIFEPSHSIEWMNSHAMVPIADNINGDLYRIYFASRNKHNISQGAYIEININNPQEILTISEKPILFAGELGCFDDSGALPNCIHKQNGETFLYYTGVNLGKTVPFRNAIGIAKWSVKSHCFEKLFRGPVLDRSKYHPHFVACPEVIFDKGIYKIWFSSCKKWKTIGNKVKHFYNIGYAESDDGFTWPDVRKTAIDFKDDDEYAFGTPRVRIDNGLYKMWFCARASDNIDTYRIKYAESVNGIHWERKDHKASIDASENGWDSEMICYPYIFDHNNKRYMLYNGNGYGLSGFGLAVLKE